MDVFQNNYEPKEGIGSMVVNEVLVHINDIVIGDTVIHNGITKTVSKEVIGGNSFIGKTLWGDSYKLGNLPVTKVT